MSQAKQQQGPVDVLSYLPGIQQSIKQNENNKEELKSLSQRVNTILDSLQKDTEFIERLKESDTVKIGKLTLQIEELRKKIPEHETHVVELTQKKDKINVVKEKITDAIQKILLKERKQREQKKNQQDALYRAKLMERITTTSSKTAPSFQSFLRGGGSETAAPPKTFKDMMKEKQEKQEKQRSK
jgi:chromosome segregation ATPase